MTSEAEVRPRVKGLSTPMHTGDASLQNLAGPFSRCHQPSNPPSPAVSCSYMSIPGWRSTRASLSSQLCLPHPTLTPSQVALPATMSILRGSASLYALQIRAQLSCYFVCNSLWVPKTALLCLELPVPLPQACKKSGPEARIHEGGAGSPSCEPYTHKRSGGAE